MSDNGNTGTRVRPKTFLYRTSVEWKREKIASLGSNEKADLTVSSPPEFGGSPGYWTPEDLFVGAIENCQLLTFLALAKRRNLPVLSYESSAEGTREFIEASFRFTRIVVRPTIVTTGATPEEEIHAVVEAAHRACLISNSVSAEIVIEPNIQFS